MSFGRWTCLLELDLDEHETAQLVAEIRACLGRRVRTTTKVRWLYDAERAPVAPMGKRVYGNVRQARFRRGAGARDSS